MSVSWREFRPFDVGEFEPLEGVFDVDAKRRTLDADKYGSIVRTYVDNQGIVGIGGCSMVFPGVAEFWSLLGEGIYRCPKDFSLAIGDSIEELFESLELNRGQAHVREGYEKGEKWLERFGFVREGLMKNYLGAGVHAHLYARYE